MVVDYGNAITATVDYKTHKINGFNIGSFFVPLDLIKQLYEKTYNSNLTIEYGKCKPIPDCNTYEYYQWDGNPESIKNVSFLKDIADRFKVSGSKYKQYHLDYNDGANEVVDVFPGYYIVNKPNENETEITIYSIEQFNKKFLYK